MFLQGVAVEIEGAMFMQHEWKEVLRLYAPAGTRRTKVEFQQVSKEDSFYLAMTSQRVDLQLDDSEHFLSENMFQVAKSCYEITVYHVDSDESEFVYTLLPFLEIDTTVAVELKYKLVVSEDCIFLVPVHARTVCISAPAYKFDEGKDCVWHPVSLTHDDLNEVTRNLSDLDINHSAPSNEVQREITPHLETGSVIRLKRGDQPEICRLSTSPGSSLPISLPGQRFDGQRWRKPLERFEVAHPYLSGQCHELEERSVLVASGEHGVMYQTRMKGPYVTELWSYDVREGVWKTLPPPPVNQCLQVAVCRLSLQKTSSLKPVHFEPENIEDIPLPSSPYENKEELGLYATFSYQLTPFASRVRKGSFGFPTYTPEFGAGPQDENLLLGDEINFDFNFDGESTDSYYDDEDHDY